MKNLTLFTDPAILNQIGHVRVPKLLDQFAREFQAIGVALPRPPEPASPSPDSAHDAYFAAVALLLSDLNKRPPRLYETLLLLENALVPENRARLVWAVKKLLPSLSLGDLWASAQAVELWFAAPEVLSQFPLVHPRRDADGGHTAVPANGSRGSTEPRLETLKGVQSNPLASDRPGVPEPVSPELTPARCEVVVATPPIETRKSNIETALARLAQLSDIDYDLVRDRESHGLGLRKETLDKEVAKRRAEASKDSTGKSVVLPEIEPWPEPVAGDEVLNQVAERYALYLVLPPGAVPALALWTAHAHCFDAFVQSPRLNLSSPEKGCGKTTTLDVLASMTPRPLRTESLTAAVLFRLVDQCQPTLLLDEVDAYLKQAEELRGLLNAGHKRGACAYRCEGDGNAIRAFKAFAPAVLAGIGTLPGTLYDRSVVIPLLKARPGELVARFDELNLQTETMLARKLARWTRDNFTALQNCNPLLPESAFNRLGDNWRPLFAIAQIAGGDWPQRAQEAFTHLTATEEAREAQKLSVALLADVRQIFQQSGQPSSMFSRHLLQGLWPMSDRSWHPALHATTNAQHWLGHQLRQLGVVSRTLRIGDERAKGYELSDLAGAFERFLKDDDSSSLSC